MSLFMHLPNLKWKDSVFDNFVIFFALTFCESTFHDSTFSLKSAFSVSNPETDMWTRRAEVEPEKVEEKCTRALCTLRK